MDAQTRLRIALARSAHEQAMASGYPSFFDDRLDALASEVAASAHEARQVVRELCDSYLLIETQPGFYQATSALVQEHEERDRAEAYRQNEVRRYVLVETGRPDKEGAQFVEFKWDEDDPYPATQLFSAANVLDYLGLIDMADPGLPAIFAVKLAAEGYRALGDEELLRKLLPLNATEDELAHAMVAPDVLKAVITSCEQMLETRGWKQVLTELGRGDRQYREGHWVDAIREYHAALESGLKYALHDEQTDHADEDGEGNGLKKLAGRAADANLLPLNYQALFGFVSSIRSPRSHGAGPRGEIAEVEVGQAEALLLGNVTRALLLYLGQRPSMKAAGA